MRSAESIAKEIQSEHLHDQLDYYAEIIEDYGNDRANQTLQGLKAKVEKLQEYYYHNTDEETADITYKTLEDVLQLIDEAINE